MSHIVKIETKIKDLGALDAACKQLGFEFVRGQTAYRWYGRFIGDSPMPEGMKVEDLGKCHHAIKVPGANYEVGVFKRIGSNNYELRWDYFSSGGLLEPLGGLKAGRLVQAYAVEKTKNEAKRLGHYVKTKTLSDGSVKLTLQGGTSW